MEDAHEGLRKETDRRIKEMLILCKIIETNVDKRFLADKADEVNKQTANKIDD